MGMVIVIICTLMTPYLIHRLEKKVKLIEWLSPVVCCYAVGILLGNTLGPWWDLGTARPISEATVMLALPLLLLSTDLLGWLKLAKETLVSFGIVLLSVMLMSYVAGKLFHGYSDEVWKMAGMMVGVYTGGTPNLMAIGKALEVRDETFVIMNAVDVVLGGTYLLVLMSVGVKVLTKFLPAFDHTKYPEEDADILNWRKLGMKQKFIHTVVLVILGAILTGASVLLSRLITGGESVSLIIMTLTALAVALSFVQKVRHFEGSQEVGQYLLLVFCVAVGSLANTSQMISGSWWYFSFCALIMFGSVLLHFLFCFFFKIDRDTAIITSVAGIFGPAFVAPMSAVLKNRTILFSGVTTGLVGYAVGNFIGIFIAYLLKG